MMTTTTMLEGHQQLQQQQPDFFLNRVSTCDRHPDVPVTGFCASCLRERLAGLETTRNRATTTTTTTKGPSAAIKSIFSRNHNVPSSSSSSSSLLPGLRRSKSFSASGRGVTASAFEPQRKSCDVRGRNTLWSLFHQELDNNYGTGEIEMDCKNLALGLGVLLPVAPPPVREEEEEEEEDDEDEEFQDVMNADEEDEILEEREEVQEQEEEEEIIQVDQVKNASRGGGEKDEVEEEAIKPMKEHIDLDSKKPSPKDLKEIAGSFWLAASVFSKKLQKWRRKQKLKKQHDGSDEGNNGKSGAVLKPGLKPRRFFESQSEVAVDVFGRRSCDIDPRFSLDCGRMSFDDPRGSWDEPRASWDGYLIGGRSVFSSRLPSMLSVVEDVSVPAVQRSDGLIPVEEDIALPGGTAQTRDYYLDSSQRRRRSLDRSSSVKRPAAADVEEPKINVASNAAKAQSTVGGGNVKVVHKLERDLRDSNSNSLRHDSSESFDFQKGGPPPPKKSRLWSKAWNIWGFIHRRSNGRNAGGGGNGVERSMSESWTELRNEGYNNNNNNNRRVCRSNSSVSSRYSFGNANLEVNGHAMKRKEEFVLERNRSGRYSYSPGRNIDNGMLRFYLTPMSGSRRRGGGLGKSRHKSSHAFTRSMMQLY